MRRRFYRQFWAAPAIFVAISVVCWAGKEFVMPTARPAFSYPAHDHHSQENVTVAVDPYDSPAKSSIFVINYRGHDLLPLFLVITNDSDEPITVSGMKAELVTADRSKLRPANEDDILRRVSHPQASGARTPLPFPTRRVKGGANSRELDEIQNSQFKARAVEPRSTQAGFLFFDVSDVRNPLSGARLYITGVRTASGNDLMYFEIPVEPSK
ncbi:MAG TPA: hypothetical protein VFB00_06525 [Terriglobales bacterium]|nr:hypothetical protein [Terriglobales bacterium]